MHDVILGHPGVILTHSGVIWGHKNKLNRNKYLFLVLKFQKRTKYVQAKNSFKTQEEKY